MNNLPLPYDNEIRDMCDEIDERKFTRTQLGNYILNQLNSRDNFYYNTSTDSPMSSTFCGTLHVLGEWLTGTQNHSDEIRNFLAHRSGVDRARRIIQANAEDVVNIYLEFLDYLNGETHIADPV